MSKFLKYASPDRINWHVVTETQRARQYLDHLEQRLAIGIDGRLTKLQRISKMLSYIAQELQPKKKLFYRCQLSWGEVFKMEEGDGEREKSQEKNPA